MEMSTYEIILIGAAPFVLLIGAATIFIGRGKQSKKGLKRDTADKDKSRGL